MLPSKPSVRTWVDDRTAFVQEAAVAIGLVAATFLGGWKAPVVVGLGLGCMNAWNWISREDMAMRDGQDGGEDDE